MVIKKYGNRRLYDTDESRYITQEELAEKIRRGAEVRVVDARTGDDLTAVTLTQLIVESRDAVKLLPVPVLHQLIRLGDDGLAEFFGRYLQLALEAYLQLRSGAQVMAGYNPFLIPLMQNPFGRMFSSAPADGQGRTSEVDELRREVEELKRSLRKRRK